MSKYKSNTLFCFSPFVMLATFAIEIVLAVYVLWRYRQSVTTRLIVAILVMLAVFQLAEYMVCEGAFGISSLDWARVGYVAITLLPPLGLHLGMKIARRRKPLLVGVAYLSALAFSIFFLSVGHGMSGSICAGNYVIFETAPEATVWYGLYYYGWLITGMVYSLRYARRTKDKAQASALRGLAVGYASFIVPTTAANLINPETINAIPSIMCGFAVIFAITLVVWVLPRVAHKR